MYWKLPLFVLLGTLTIGGGIYIASGQTTSTVDAVDPDATAFIDGVPAANIAFVNGRPFAKTAGFTCGTDTVDDADGNTYDTVQVGTQCWTKQSMRVGTQVNGTTDMTNDGTIEKYCYSDTASNCTTNHPNQPDGALYQWHEAMQYSTTEGAQGICPAGWHIPTDGEIYTMENFLDSTVNDPAATGYRGTDIGTKLKPGGSSGLEWNLAGFRHSANGSFYSRDSYGYFWSSSEDSASDAWGRRLDSGNVSAYRSLYNKNSGHSVRCIKD